MVQITSLLWIGFEDVDFATSSFGAVETVRQWLVKAWESFVFNHFYPGITGQGWQF